MQKIVNACLSIIALLIVSGLILATLYAVPVEVERREAQRQTTTY